MWHYQVCHESETGNNPHHVGSRNHFSRWPTCAVLPHTSNLTVIPSSPLAYVWLSAAIGAIGVGIGVFAFCKGSETAGTVCLLTTTTISRNSESFSSEAA
jgi:hypothetical protein